MRFATPEKFEDASIKKTIMVCPYCKKRTAVKKQYLRFDEVRIDGRITHTEGKYFL
jgi:hypothetical protein